MLKNLLSQMKDGQTLILTIKKEEQSFIAVSGVNEAKSHSGIFKIANPDVETMEKELVAGVPNIFASIEENKKKPVNTIPVKKKEEPTKPAATVNKTVAKPVVEKAPDLFAQGDVSSIKSKEEVTKPDPDVEVLDDGNEDTAEQITESTQEIKQQEEDW